VLAAYAAWKRHLQSAGATLVDFEPAGWQSSTEIYAAIQASEAAAIHRRYLAKLEPTLEPRIAERLRWGASLTNPDLDSLRSRHAHFRAAIAALLAQFDFLMLPAAPVNRLRAGDDFTSARPAILRYTTPFSLSGLPVVTLPGEMIDAPFGTGIQLAAPQLEDAGLLAYAANLAR
jgi:Asp-tRNA(Asn)/Glu-tRNA(Gln) amidotransferase A subunit family amidase